MLSFVSKELQLYIETFFFPLSLEANKNTNITKAQKVVLIC